MVIWLFIILENHPGAEIWKLLTCADQNLPLPFEMEVGEIVLPLLPVGWFVEEWKAETLGTEGRIHGTHVCCGTEPLMVQTLHVVMWTEMQKKDLL